MKILLVKDVYKLGRAGDIKKVADGYGRNFLIPQGFAVLATQDALKKVQQLKAQAEIRRNILNNELKEIGHLIKDMTLVFPSKADEFGKLYGSITTQDIAVMLTKQIRHEVKRQQVDMHPIRTLGKFTAHIRLTMDLVPDIKIIVHREGESLENIYDDNQEAIINKRIFVDSDEELVAAGDAETSPTDRLAGKRTTPAPAPKKTRKTKK